MAVRMSHKGVATAHEVGHGGWRAVEAELKGPVLRDGLKPALRLRSACNIDSLTPLPSCCFMKMNEALIDLEDPEWP